MATGRSVNVDVTGVYDHAEYVSHLVRDASLHRPPSPLTFPRYLYLHLAYLLLVRGIAEPLGASREIPFREARRAWSVDFVDNVVLLLFYLCCPLFLV